MEKKTNELYGNEIEKKKYDKSNENRIFVNARNVNYIFVEMIK